MVRGGGDLASGVVYRLVKAGFPVVVTELARPLAIRRAVAFASAVFEGQVTIEGLTARLVSTATDAQAVIAAGEIPVLTDEDDTRLQELAPVVGSMTSVPKVNLCWSPNVAATVTRRKTALTRDTSS